MGADVFGGLRAVQEAMVAVQSSKAEPLLLGLREDVRKGLDDVLNRLPDLNRQRVYVEALEGSMQDVRLQLQLVQEQLQVGHVFPLSFATPH